MQPFELAATLSWLIADDAIGAVDVAAFSHWFDVKFRVSRQTILAPARWRGIGCVLPVAIGAQLARPGRQVVAFVGDGAFLQSMAKLTTAVRYELPLVVIVVNNATNDIDRRSCSIFTTI